MAFLKKIFAKKNPLTVLADAHRQKAWAEVVNCAADIDPAELEQNPECRAMLDEARATLAEMNLREARTRFSQGDVQSGQEHIALARQYGATEEALVEASSAAVDGHGSESSTANQAPAAPKADCNSCTGGRAGQPAAEAAMVTDDLDLLFAGLPRDQAECYRCKSEQFLQALQFAYAGMDDEACQHFSALPETEKDLHFRFEYGAALGRLGQGEEAVRLLNEVLDEDLNHLPALEALLDLNLAGLVVPGLEGRLAMIEQEADHIGFAAACRARLAWKSGDAKKVVEQGEVALAQGEGSAELVQMLAVIYENQEQYDRAEHLLGLLSSGGCGGGAHPSLAEFWLRRGTQLDRALESFKGAARNEPENPRWPLRIGQTYLAKGWRKDGIKALDRLAAAGGLPEDLLEELNRSIKNA